jgi:hypothetical protein
MGVPTASAGYIRFWYQADLTVALSNVLRSA